MRDTGIHEDSVKIWKVLKTEPENHDINSLYLEVDDERLKKRRAGQWASIRVLSDDGWSEPHPFTISCASEDKILRFTIKVEKYVQAEYPHVLYVPGYATREVLQKHLPLEGTSCYLCGPTGMQESILRELEACGVDPESVVKENFG
jgi:ferredoxin-NADP reductase